VLDEITSGAFAKEWAQERASGYANFESLRTLGTQHNPFTPAEARLRELLSQANRDGK
jgi:ketol-acid reductoisomerase